VATCVYNTGTDPFSKQEVYIARNMRDRKLQRALLRFFKPANYFRVGKALERAGRADLTRLNINSQGKDNRGGEGQHFPPRVFAV
jgi:Domain of unknown function (DUF3362)